MVDAAANTHEMLEANCGQNLGFACIVASKP